jgi:hypothetical protein
MRTRPYALAHFTFTRPVGQCVFPPPPPPGFEWVHDFEPGHAITAMEIYHGFLRKPFTPVHAFMYRRDPSFISGIASPEERTIFAFDYPGNEEIRARRDKLMWVASGIDVAPLSISRTAFPIEVCLHGYTHGPHDTVFLLFGALLLVVPVGGGAVCLWQPRRRRTSVLQDAGLPVLVRRAGRGKEAARDQLEGAVSVLFLERGRPREGHRALSAPFLLPCRSPSRALSVARSDCGVSCARVFPCCLPYPVALFMFPPPPPPPFSPSPYGRCSRT